MRHRSIIAGTLFLTALATAEAAPLATSLAR